MRGCEVGRGCSPVNPKGKGKCNGKGAGAAMLEHIMQVARDRGYKRLSLETGSTPSFLPAIAMYKKRGFENGACFGEYETSDFNQFFHLDL